MRSVLVAVMLALMPAGVPAQNLESALAAYRAGDCETAARELRPLAERGVATAQFSLGVMYYNGRGVPQDFGTAHMWFSVAAANGFDSARGARDRIAEQMTAAAISEA